MSAAPSTPSGEPTAATRTAPDAAPSPISIVGGNPTPAEVAAVTAVLTAALEELADDHGQAVTRAPSAWEVGQRGLRTPLRPGPGAWRAFSG